MAYSDDLEIELLLSSVYMPYEAASLSDDVIAILVEHAKRKRCRLVFGCDTNSNHPQWSCVDKDISGKSISNFISLIYVTPVILRYLCGFHNLVRNLRRTN